MTAKIIAFSVLSILALAWLFKTTPVDTTTHHTTSPTTTSYVQYSCLKHCGGFADRLKGIMSAYAWSLITNRSFLIEMPWPCPFESMYDPNEVDWSVRKNMLSGSSNDRTGRTERKVGYGWRDYNILTAENIIAWSANATNLISVNSGLMFMNAFAVNPHLAPRIKELGYEPAKFKMQYVFHKWFPKLFKLKPAMAEGYARMRRLVGKDRPGRHKLICAQVRKGGSTRSYLQDNVVSKVANTVQLYWRFMNDTFIQKLNGSDYTIYVTSDNEGVKQEARDFFGAQKVVTFADSNFHFDMDFQPWLFFFDKSPERVRKNCRKIEGMLLEFELLKECDMAVVSHSGFGLLGLWNRPDPGKDLYVHSTVDYVRRGVFSRENLEFIKLDNLDEFYFGM
jgi:hypothetical protein